MIFIHILTFLAFVLFVGTILSYIDATKYEILFFMNKAAKSDYKKHEELSAKLFVAVIIDLILITLLYNIFIV